MNYEDGPGGTAALRYLDATHVEHRSGNCAGVRICTADDEPLGALDGVLLEPATRRVRYFVVERPALLTARRYLLDANTPATLDTADRMLRVDAHEDDLERFDARSVMPFSDADLLAAMFAR